MASTMQRHFAHKALTFGEKLQEVEMELRFYIKFMAYKLQGLFSRGFSLISFVSSRDRRTRDTSGRPSSACPPGFTHSDQTTSSHLQSAQGQSHPRPQPKALCPDWGHALVRAVPSSGCTKWVGLSKVVACLGSLA